MDIDLARYDDGFWVIMIDGKEATEPLVRAREIYLFLKAVLNFEVCENSICRYNKM